MGKFTYAGGKDGSENTLHNRRERCLEQRTPSFN
jgi:hypothetical protein